MVTQPRSNSWQPRSNWQQEHHGDLGALRERVSGLERASSNLSDQVANNQRDTARQIETLQSNLSAQIRDMSSSYAAAKSTNWGTIIAAAGFIVLLGGAVLTPILGDLNKLSDTMEKLSDKSERKDDFKKSWDELNSWASSLRDRLQLNENHDVETKVALARMDGMENERHETYIRDHYALIARVDAIDNSLIKRPEIEAAFDAQKSLTTLTTSALSSRVDAVIGSLNELRHDVGSSYTQGDIIKHTLERIDNMQSEINILIQASGRALGLHDGISSSPSH